METIIKKTEIIFASEVKAKKDGLYIIVEDKTIFVKWAECSHKLAAASQAERMKFGLSPSGYGIHWPLIDEDLSIGGLIGLKRE